jgi:hypothetical protein
MLCDTLHIRQHQFSADDRHQHEQAKRDSVIDYEFKHETFAK